MASNVPQHLPPLNTIDELRNALGKNYILFCGSAISAFPRSSHGLFLPMVDEVMTMVFGGYADYLKHGNYYERLLGAYANALTQNDEEQYASIRWQLKFEEILWSLEKLFDRKHVNDLLEALYLCKNNEHNFNHAAIAALCTSKNGALACLTTNFDNCIENAANNSLSAIVHSTRLPPDRTEFEKGGCYLKLHGDVVERIFVATTPALFTAEQSNDFNYLQTLLEGRTVLVVGYSATGDIDIAPHLRAASLKGTKFIWMVLQSSDVGRIPYWATHWFYSDLSKQNPSENWLLGLAGIDASTNTYSGPDWQGQAKTWLTRTNLETFKEFLSLLVREKVKWPLLQLEHVSQWQSKSSNTPQDRSLQNLAIGFECTSHGIYFSAYRNLRKAKFGAADEPAAVRLFWLGFTLWRLGYFQKAMQYFEEAFNIFAEPSKRLNSPRTKAEILRLFAESATEKVALFSSPPRRKEFVASIKLDDKLKLLESQIQTEPSQKSLADLTLLNLNYLLANRQVSQQQILRQVNDIAERAFNLQNWLVATAATHLLLQYGFPRASELMEELNKKLLRESNVVLLQYDKRAFRSRQNSAQLPYPFNLIIRWFLAHGLAALRELIYQGKLLLWRYKFYRDKIDLES